MPATMTGTDENWVIVGGGIHGVHLAVRLLAEAHVDAERLRIVDPGPRLLHSWRRCSANTGMGFLRSPAVHHLDLDPRSLLRFALDRGLDAAMFTEPYNRPSVQLFADHCDEVIACYGLQDLHIRARAARVELHCDQARVHLDSGSSIGAHRVILAMGTADQPRWPSWASALRRDGALVHHIFQRDYDLVPERWPERIAVIGGGITACQVALRLATPGRAVHLVSRHAPRRHQFDSEPGWLGPKNMRRYSQIRDPATRRRTITEARHGGSAPPDVLRALRRSIERGHIHWHEGECTARRVGDGVFLMVGSEPIAVDGVLLATGFDAQRPGGRLVDDLVESEALPCASCGYPLVDRYLRWHPRVFVSGPLAELEIGPVSRNIAGARRAAERIVRSP